MVIEKKRKIETEELGYAEKKNQLFVFECRGRKTMWHRISVAIFYVRSFEYILFNRPMYWLGILLPLLLNLRTGTTKKEMTFFLLDWSKSYIEKKWQKWKNCGCCQIPRSVRILLFSVFCTGTYGIFLNSSFVLSRCSFTVFVFEIISVCQFERLGCISDIVPVIQE